MAVWYVKSGAGAADYNAAHTYVLHDKIVPTVADVTSNVATARKWVWECTTAGTTNAAPTWPASVTQDVTTFTVNGCVFTARKPGFSSGTTADWTFATIYLSYGLQATLAAGDTVYVSNNHAETQSTAYTLVVVANATSVQCVNDSAAPPTANATTATVSTSGNSVFTFQSSTDLYVYGVTFSSGVGASGAASLLIGSWHYEQCNFILATTDTASRISLGNSSRLTNCGLKFAATAQGINGNDVNGLAWRGVTLLAGGSTPTALFQAGAMAGVIDGLDLTNASASINLAADGTLGRNIKFRNVRLPTSFSGSVNSSTPGIGSVYEMTNGDNTGTNYTIQRKTQYGTLTQETTIVRTSGASDGVTPLAWKMVSTSAAGPYPMASMQTPEIVQWNGTTGSSITVTVEAVSSASLNNDELWLEVMYLSASGAPLGTLITSAKAGPVVAAGAVTTSTATWTSSPSTPVYQKMSVSFTPQLKGFIHASVKLCKASKTVYVDPFITVSGVTVSASRQIPGGMMVNEIASGGVPMSRVFTGM